MEGPQAPGAAPGIQALPLDLLVACLRSLTLNERHSKAALVCKRWAAAVNSPQLLTSLSLTLGTHDSIYSSLSAAATASCLASSRSLLEWLLQRSAATALPEQLSMSVRMPYKVAEPAWAELCALADGCLTACSAQLLSLRLFVMSGSMEQPPLHDVLPWYVHMRQLQTLELESSYMHLRLLVSLGSLSGLHSLSLSTERLVLGAGVALPAGLAHLGLEVCEAEGAFSQAPHSMLSSLRMVGRGSSVALGSMAALIRMTQLVSLELEDCHLPAGHPCPPSLKSLVVVFRGSTPPAADLDGLVSQQAGLTGLALSYESHRLPAGLSGLSQLQWLYIHTQSTLIGGLPAGGWLRRLRRLCLEYDMVEASVPELTQATHLSRLGLLSLPIKGESPWFLGRWEAFWQFAATHPPLQTLDIQSNEGAETSGKVVLDVAAACMHLAAKRPSLQVSLLNVESDWPLDELKAMAPAQEG